jgi:hypothetical protein
VRRRLFNLAAAVSLVALLALVGWRAFGGLTTTITYNLATLTKLVATRTEVQTDFGIHIGPVRLPLWPLVLLSLVMPTMWILAALLRRFDPVNYGQPRSRICLVCGYDLRATPDRCPECGTTPAA